MPQPHPALLVVDLRRRLDDGVLHHAQGHREDYLYLNVPLRGDFEVSCEIRSFGPDQMQLAYGAIVNDDLLKTARRPRSSTSASHDERLFEPPLEESKEWNPLRRAVKNNKYTVFIQGRQILRRPLAERTRPLVGDPPALHRRQPACAGRS